MILNDLLGKILRETLLGMLNQYRIRKLFIFPRKAGNCFLEFIPLARTVDGVDVAIECMDSVECPYVGPYYG